MKVLASSCEYELMALQNAVMQSCVKHSRRQAQLVATKLAAITTNCCCSVVVAPIVSSSIRWHVSREQNIIPSVPFSVICRPTPYSFINFFAWYISWYLQFIFFFVFQLIFFRRHILVYCSFPGNCVFSHHAHNNLSCVSFMQ